MVATMAGNFCLSRTIPTMPIIKEAGKEKIPNNPARVVSGLPQPGRSIIIIPIIRTATTSNFIAIFPNRILTIS